jgi:hypothetical protein
MAEERGEGTKNRIRFGKEGTFSGMNLDSMTMRMEAVQPISTGGDVPLSEEDFNYLAGLDRIWQ